jgi:pantothenate kinase
MTDQVSSHDLARLTARMAGQLSGDRRFILGVTGAPGAGKSTLAAAVAARAPRPAALVPMDGFHLDDSVLAALRRVERKGAPDTFDAAGFVQLLRRLRARDEPVVYAPIFDRDREQAIAGALAVPAEVQIVVVEGNYLLADGAFADVRGLLDECWYVEIDDDLRRERLVARHMAHGRSRDQAQAWVREVDEPNARLVTTSRDRADLIVQLGRGEEG